MNDRGPSKYSMSVSMYRGGRGSGRPRTAPPDLPSLLLDARICYLGMPVSHSLSLFILCSGYWLGTSLFLLPYSFDLISCLDIFFPL